MVAVRVRLLLLALLLGLGVPAQAAVTITFLSRDFGESFPHAFVEVTGATDADPATAVDTNYGFTAKAVTPAILMGSVGGKVDQVDAGYVRKSQRHFAVRLSDAQYAEVLRTVDEWRNLPAPSYNLNRRNCVHFVAAVARAIGLDAADAPGLMKKPRSFLVGVTAKNPTVDTSIATVPHVDPATIDPKYARGR